MVLKFSMSKVASFFLLDRLTFLKKFTGILFVFELNNPRRIQVVSLKGNMVFLKISAKGVLKANDFLSR